MGSWIKYAIDQFCHIGHAFKDLLFPSKCLICGSFYLPPKTDDGSTKCANEPKIHDKPNDYGFKYHMSYFLCPDCLSDHIPYVSPFCTQCGRMFKSRAGDDHECGPCIVHPNRYRMARAAGIYNHSLMEAIHAFKYKGKTQLGKPFGKILFASYLRFWNTSTVDLIIPVPLHISRFRARGFNQSFLMIKDWLKWAEKLNMMTPRWQIDKYSLIRVRKTLPQTGLGKKKRRLNLKDAFTVKHPDRINGKRIIIVDDVYTTGSTVNECSKTLLKGGALSVDVLTLARAV